mmetsp:Transcript_14400/g.22977  ORF Transcript_14400/g.22977 Transcript_14400/m.22977 type:complete len:200 (+) Transcript_14400:356-955(+)
MPACDKATEEAKSPCAPRVQEVLHCRCPRARFLHMDKYYYTHETELGIVKKRVPFCGNVADIIRTNFLGILLHPRYNSEPDRRNHKAEYHSKECDTIHEALGAGAGGRHFGGDCLTIHLLYVFVVVLFLDGKVYIARIKFGGVEIVKTNNRLVLNGGVAHELVNTCWERVGYLSVGLDTVKGANRINSQERSALRCVDC